MAQDLVLKVIMQAQDKASAALERVRAASSGLSGSLNKTQQELAQTNASLSKMKKFADLQQKLKTATTDSDKLTHEINQLSQEIRKNGKASEQQVRRMQMLEKASQKVSMSQQKLSDQSSRLSLELRKAGVDTRHFASEQVRLYHSAAKTNAQLAKQQEALLKVERIRNSASKAMMLSAGAKGVGWLAKDNAVSLATSLQGSVNSAISEEDAMLGVIRQVASLKNADGSLNHAEIAKMRQEIQALSGVVPMATVDIIKMYAAGAKMNVPREELRGYVTEAIKAANAFESANPEQLAEELGRIRANFKLSKEAASELVNVMNYLDDNALVSGDQLIDYMNRVSGSMGLAKMGEKYVAALGSALMSAGTEASTAAQAVGSLMTRLATAPEMKPVKEALQSIGLDAKAVQKGMVTDAQATLEKIIVAVKKMPKEQQAGVLKDLAGGEYNRVFASLIANTELWGEQIRLATSQDAIGSLDKEFDVRMQAMSAKWEIFKNQLFNTQSGFGRGLFDGLQYGMDVLGQLLASYNTWAAQNPKQAAMLAKIAATAVLLLGAIAGLALAFSAILLPVASARMLWASLLNSFSGGVGILTAIGSALRVLGTSLMVFGRAAMTFLFTNPFGWAILAIGALYLLWRNWDTVKNAVIRGWNMMRTALRNNPFLAALSGPIGLIAALIANWDRVKATVTNAWAIIRGVLRTNPMLGALAGPIGLIASLIANFDRLIAKVQQAKAAMANFSVAKVASGAWQNIKGMAGFATGGYTGHGGINEVAGVVHKGEVVFNQADVARFGGWQALERLRTTGLVGAALDKANRFFNGDTKKQPRSEVVRSSNNTFRQPENIAMAGGDNITIHIHATPAQNAQDIATAVQRELARWAAAKQRRANSSLRDRD